MKRPEPIPDFAEIWYLGGVAIEDIKIILSGGEVIKPEIGPAGCGSRNRLKFIKSHPKRRKLWGWVWRIEASGTIQGQMYCTKIEVSNRARKPRIVSYEKVPHPDYPDFPRANVTIMLGKIKITATVVGRKNEVDLANRLTDKPE